MGSRETLFSSFTDSTDPIVAVSCLLEILGKTPQQIQALVAPEKHSHLISLLGGLTQKIQRIAQRKASPINEIQGGYEDDGSDRTPVGDRTKFTTLYTGLLPHAKNTERFFTTLLKFRGEGLPSTLDGWIFWSQGDWSIFLRTLADICKAKAYGDEKVVAQFVLERVIGELQKDPTFLETHPACLKLSGGNMYMRNIVDIYALIGEGTYGLIAKILLKMQPPTAIVQKIGRMQTQEARPPVNTKGGTVRQKIPQISRLKGGKHMSEVAHHIGPSHVDARRKGGTLVASNQGGIGAIIFRLNQYFVEKNISCRVGPNDVATNAFGSTIISSGVDDRRRHYISEALQYIKHV